MSKLLTITIPSYNVGKYLPEVLPTFLHPSVLDYIEILIVNDGSIDNTAEIAAQFQQKYPETVFVHNKENGGHGSTINTGISLATGKYFKVVDGDDWVDTAAFCRFVEKLRSIDADMVISPFNYIQDGSNKVLDTIKYNELSEDTLYEFDAVLPIINWKRYAMHSLVFRTSILKKIPPISEHCFYVDVEYVNFPLKYVNTVSLIDEAIYQYRVGNAIQSTAAKNKQRNRQMHLHVIGRINEYRQDMPDTAKEIVDFQLAGLCENHISILLSLPISPTSKKEIKEFLCYIETNMPRITPSIKGIKAKALIRSKARLYLPLALFYHIKYPC